MSRLHRGRRWHYSAVSGLLVFLSACTSTVTSLDTALLEVSPANPPADQANAAAPQPPSIRPAVPVTNSATPDLTGATTTALAPSAVDGAAQITSVVDNSETERPAVASAAPAQQAPDEQSQLADQRIAQANAAPVAPATPRVPYAPTIASADSSAPQANPQRPGLLNRLFSRNRSTPAPKAEIPQPTQIAVASAAGTTATPAAPRPTVAVASAAGLPGVDRERVLGIEKQEVTTVARPVQLASAAGLARLAPNGLRTQHSGVDVKCLKPALVRVLKQAERKFGKPVVVTSGYRSPKRNANARGAKNSLHMYCAAADVQIEGVSKWKLAAFFRSMPGRGGVGTYCHTKSVHVDIGPKRDWNWRCRRG